MGNTLVKINGLMDNDEDKTLISAWQDSVVVRFASTILLNIIGQAPPWQSATGLNRLVADI
jgi:hypothetical protein